MRKILGASGRHFRGELVQRFEKHRLVIALQADVEAIDRAALRLAPGRSASRGGRPAPAPARDRRRCGLAAEIDPRVEMQQHAARKHREQDVRRLRLAVGIRHDARLDGIEGVAAFRVGAAAAKTLERRIRQRALVLRIGEAALRVGLPDSSMQSGTGLPSPSNTWPSMRMRSPDVRGDQVIGEGSFQSYSPSGVRP